jgi:hypothetical protein
MAGLQPGLEPLRRQGDRIGLRDADRIEAERSSALDEGFLESLAV